MKRKATDPMLEPVVAGTSNERWLGVLEGVHDTLLYGWAVDTVRTDSRVVVEILIDGEIHGSVIADVARRELVDRFGGDGCHGFIADLGRLVRAKSGTITARIANTDTTLEGHVCLDATEPPLSSVTNHVMSDGGLRIQGWAFDPRNQSRVVQIRALVGNQLVGECSANRILPFTRGFGIGTNGFILDLPLSLANGETHEVRVMDDNGNELNGSPVTLCLVASGASAVTKTTPPALLAKVLESYERYLPRSVSMEHYTEWSELFERSEVPRSPDAGAHAPHKVAVIVYGAGGPSRTLQSLHKQRGITCQVYRQSESQSFTALLSDVLLGAPDAIACVRAGDTIRSHGLAAAAQGLALPSASVSYTDSEVLQSNGSVNTITPWFKPTWNPEYAFATDYPLELMLARTEAVKAALSANPGIDNAPALAWAVLASVWTDGAQRIVHVPRALYRFYSPLSNEEHALRLEAASSALQAVEPRSSLQPVPGTGVSADHVPRRLVRAFAPREKKPSVSLIIPTRDNVQLLERCITSIREHTVWPKLEIIVVDNDSVDAETKAYFRKLAKDGVRVLPAPGAFNFARINNSAVEAAKGEIVGLINNDIETLHEGWLDEIIGHLRQPGVGAVGAKLLWPNNMVQHGGVLLGMGNVAGHYGNLLADQDQGDHSRNLVVQQVSGVTAACLFVRKEDYLAVGGMDENAFPVAFNDVDLCLKIREQGKAIVWTPFARLLHAESASRGHEDTPQKKARAMREIDQLRKRWGKALANDPAYHPSLNLDPQAQAFNGLALPPRDRAPRMATIRRNPIKKAGE